MTTKPFDELLDPDFARVEANEDIKAALPVLREGISESTWVFARAQTSAPADVDVHVALGARHDVFSHMRRIFSTSVFRWYRAQARASGVNDGRCGAVTFIQRFSTSLLLIPHFHVLPRLDDESHPRRIPWATTRSRRRSCGFKNYLWIAGLQSIQ